MSKTWSVPDFILLYRAEAANPGLSVQGGDGKHRNRHVRFSAGCASRPEWWRGFRARRGRAGGIRIARALEKMQQQAADRIGGAPAIVEQLGEIGVALLHDVLSERIEQGLEQLDRKSVPPDEACQLRWRFELRSIAP